MPLRVAIEDVYKIGGIGTVPVGKVVSGILKMNKDICFGPSGLKSCVRSLEMMHS